MFWAIKIVYFASTNSSQRLKKSYAGILGIKRLISQETCLYFNKLSTFRTNIHEVIHSCSESWKIVFSADIFLPLRDKIFLISLEWTPVNSQLRFFAKKLFMEKYSCEIFRSARELKVVCFLDILLHQKCYFETSKKMIWG